MRSVVALSIAGIWLAPSAFGQQTPAPSAPTFAISGRVLNSRGDPPHELLLWVSDVGHGGGESRGEPLKDDGSFNVRRLPPGIYVVAAGVGSEPNGTPRGFEGGVLKEVVAITTHDVTDLVIRTHPSVSIRGHVRYDEDRPGTPRPEVHLLSNIALRGVSMTAVGSWAAVRPDGTFVIDNVFGPSIIRVGYTLPPGAIWFADSIRLNGRDITNVPLEFENEPDADLEVVFTQRSGGAIGRVVDLAGLPSPESYAVVFSADPALWETWSTTTNVIRTNDDGRFFVGAPAGRYLAVAFPAEAFRSTDDVTLDFRELAKLATPFEIPANRRAHVELTTRRLTPALR